MASNLPALHIDEEPLDTTPPIQETTFELHDEDFDVYNGNTLSPLSARFPPMASMNQNFASPARSSHLFPCSENESTSAPDSTLQPFNFAPQQYVVSRPPSHKQAEIGRRRGHKYARSSVSHQIILSPTPRSPLQLPTSLPIPTFKEFRSSMTSGQRMRWLFCLLQFAVAGYVQWSSHESMATEALSHLLFYDALAGVLCVVVSVGRNFDVWTRSSLRHPFGLERSELVAGLAMSIVLLFMGLDLISHGLTHTLENVGGHEAHHAHVQHEHEGEEGMLNLPALAAILSTLVAARLGGDSRVGRSVRSSSSRLPRTLQNPPQVLILLCSTILALAPLLTIHISQAADFALAFALAAAAIVLGVRLCYSIGRVLLMSYPTSNEDEIKEVVAGLWEDDAVAEVQEAKIWQVHYGLCMANFRVLVRHAEAVERVREKIASLVRSRLAGESGSGNRNVKWEISSMISVVDD